ncbi:glyoxylase-like metal-dependent hydrolase (beta-lactamase superfamily II) [Nocardioides sp. J9]|uniref:MBL fold metallo-hydrolase n=1 Tax=Nocardioides sp. J9 TaxID=935844 RepID=UPI0011A8DBBF|nr:MBL fold metallo-hydrolase [Nocardioides sp. J9]TWG89679.1 glyoxylase-like metal-dependent hydrolase (beta-lactamase superfamily II) [Nocardioides sp. J9]
MTVHLGERLALIELPLPLEGLTSVNCYVVRGDDETVLVDPGWSSPATERALLAGLEELGLTPGDLSRVLTTHHHWDHYTQALAWQGKHDLPVHLGRGDDHSIRAWFDLEGAFPRQVGLLRAAGAPALAEEIANLPAEVHEQDMDFDLPAAWLDDGDVIDCGGVSIRALATPGHTRGHVCFEVPESGFLLTGDHVLPRISPSIAYEREPDPLSLLSYLSSLRLVAERPELRLLPAHGAVDTEPGSAATRARELLQHHAERLELITGLVADGRSTAHDVARSMPWTRRGRQLHELDLVHRMTAVLEAEAHLVLLEHQGLLQRSSVDGVDHYAAA